MRCSGLAPGGLFQVTKTDTLPAGVWVVGVLADSTDLVPETDETDNYVYLTP